MTYLVDALNDALTLTLTRLLEPVCIVRQQMLVDAGGTADGSQRKVRTVRTQQRSSVYTVILKFIIAIDKPLGDIITISQHPINVELERLLGLPL